MSNYKEFVKTIVILELLDYNIVDCEKTGT